MCLVISKLFKEKSTSGGLAQGHINLGTRSEGNRELSVRRSSVLTQWVRIINGIVKSNFALKAMGEALN